MGSIIVATPVSVSPYPSVNVTPKRSSNSWYTSFGAGAAETVCTRWARSSGEGGALHRK